MDAGGRVTAAWCTATSVKSAKSQNPSASAATCRIAVLPCKLKLQPSHHPSPRRTAGVSTPLKSVPVSSGGWWTSGVPVARPAGSSATRPERCSACRRCTTAPTRRCTANTAPRTDPRPGEPAITPHAPPSGGQGRGLRWGHLPSVFEFFQFIFVFHSAFQP